jgi:hypothetical protein
MTICVGWKDHDQVFIVSDSLQTYVGEGSLPSLRPDATFNEPPESPDQRRTEEAACKVFSPGNGIVAGVAGLLSPALEALIHVRDQLRYGHAFRDVVRSMPSFGKKKDFEILVGGGPPGDVQLYRLHANGKCHEIKQDRSPAVLGSLPETGKDFVKRTVLLPYLIKGLVDADPERVLATVLMSLQAFGRRVNLIADFAGGAFFGMRTMNGVVYAQPDILYAVFSKDDLPRDLAEIAIVGIRGNALISQPAGRRAAVLVSDLHEITDSEIEYALQTRPLNFTVAPPFFALIERTLGAVIGVESRRGPPHRFLEFSPTATGAVITLGPEVLARIDQMPDPSLGRPEKVVHHFFTEPEPTAPTSPTNGVS